MSQYHPLIQEIQKAQEKSGIPEFGPGDTIRLSVKIVEGDKERIQDYEGVVIRLKGGSINESVTVRRVSYGVGMERTFPLHSPRIESIEVVRHGRVRRAKLYYLRELRGRKARIHERKETAAEAAAAAAAKTEKK